MADYHFSFGDEFKMFQRHEDEVRQLFLQGDAEEVKNNRRTQLKEVFERIDFVEVI